jgi:S1-C subfamily serine protease
MQLAPGTGLEITEVEPGSPAQSAAIEPGDALVAVGKFSDLTVDDLGGLLEYVEPGETIALTLRRIEPRLVIQNTLRLKAR